MKIMFQKGHISWAENVGFKRWRPGRDGEDVVPEKFWEPRLSAFLFGVTMKNAMKTSIVIKYYSW